MRKLIIIIIMLLAVSIFISLPSNAKVKYKMPESNIEFFLANNNGTDGLMDTLSTLSQLLCIEDKIQNKSIEERLRVSKICLDSKATEDDWYIVNDGAWHSYVYQALDIIKDMCAIRQNEVCK